MLLFNQQFAAKYLALSSAPAPKAAPESGEAPSQSVTPDPNDMTVKANRQAILQVAKDRVAQISADLINPEVGNGKELSNEIGQLGNLIERAEAEEMAGTAETKPGTFAYLRVLVQAHLPTETANSTPPTTTKAPGGSDADIAALDSLAEATATALGGPSATVGVLETPINMPNLPPQQPAETGLNLNMAARGAIQPLDGGGLASIGQVGGGQTATAGEKTTFVPNPTIDKPAKTVEPTVDKVGEAEVRAALAYFKANVAPSISSDRASGETQFSYNNKNYKAERLSTDGQDSYKISAA